MFDIAEIKVRVSKGFALLSREQRARVDLHTLDMDSDWNCVLGQIFGTYAAGMELLLPCEDDYAKRERLGMEYGFFQTYRNPSAFKIYDILQTEWLALLSEERESVLS